MCCPLQHHHHSSGGRVKLKKLKLTVEACMFGLIVVGNHPLQQIASMRECGSSSGSQHWCEMSYDTDFGKRTTLKFLSNLCSLDVKLLYNNC